MSIEDVPHEIIKLILEYVPDAYRLSTCLVCRLWRAQTQLPYAFTNIPKPKEVPFCPIKKLVATATLNAFRMWIFNSDWNILACVWCVSKDEAFAISQKIIEYARKIAVIPNLYFINVPSICFISEFNLGRIIGKVLAQMNLVAYVKKIAWKACEIRDGMLIESLCTGNFELFVSVSDWYGNLNVCGYTELNKCPDDEKVSKIMKRTLEKLTLPTKHVYDELIRLKFTRIIALLPPYPY